MPRVRWLNSVKPSRYIKTVMRNLGDILNKSSLTGEEVRQLNFIRNPQSYQFRKYYRQGLRSHIFEVLSADAVLKETEGEFVNGIRCFPRAAPKHVLRILRTRFRTLDHVLDEIKKYALVLHFLGPDLIARSDEFIVAYTGSGESEIVLCGLQEYVEGAILDSWGLLGQDPLNTFYRSRFPDEDLEKGWMSKVLYAIATFVRRTRKMIVDEGHIPDLAGNGNLILTKDGKIKLVDINNILRVNQDESILIDDKGYPACDKSVEVLAILDQQILKNEGVAKDPLYAHFLSADRTKKVKRLENQFFQNPRLVSAVRGSPETL